jgi:hypothetical protein
MLRQEIAVLKEQLKVYSNHERLNSSPLREHKVQLTSYHQNKSLSPHNTHQNNKSTNRPSKLRSTIMVKIGWSS